MGPVGCSLSRGHKININREPRFAFPSMACPRVLLFLAGIGIFFLPVDGWMDGWIARSFLQK